MTDVFQGAALVQWGAQHTYNQYNKPKRCKCGGRPVDRVISFPHYINITCTDCGAMLAYWRSSKFLKPSEVDVE